MGPEPERDYPWEDRIAEVRAFCEADNGITAEQQMVITDILIGFRDLSDDPEEYETYERFTRMLRHISTLAEPLDDVEDILRRVGEWLHEQLHEVCFHCSENLAHIAEDVAGRIQGTRGRRGAD